MQLNAKLVVVTRVVVFNVYYVYRLQISLQNTQSSKWNFNQIILSPKFALKVTRTNSKNKLSFIVQW